MQETVMNKKETKDKRAYTKRQQPNHFVYKELIYRLLVLDSLFIK